MKTTLSGRKISPLDTPPTQFDSEPFCCDTPMLLRSVRDHDFATLSHLCDDDFGIVDVDPAGIRQLHTARGTKSGRRAFTGSFGPLQQAHPP
ncbi:MAG: hypothetical protein O3C27_08230, partial [Actinomycetota bacterium]|nr:hypothetical protein [Actinomycetota bacterium]